MVQKWAFSSFARHSTWYRSCRWRILLDIPHDNEVGVVEFCLPLYIVQKWALSSTARHSIWYRRGGCPVALDVLHGTVVGNVEFCSTLYIVQKWARSSSSRHSKCYRSGLYRYSSWYRSGRCRILLNFLHGKKNRSTWALLDILHGTEVGPFEFCSASYVVQKWALSSSVPNSTTYWIMRCRVLIDILNDKECGIRRVLLDILNSNREYCRVNFDKIHGTKRSLSSPARHSTCYRS